MLVSNFQIFCWSFHLLHPYLIVYIVCSSNYHGLFLLFWWCLNSLFSLSVLSRFALLSLDVHSAVSSSNSGQSLLPHCFMTDASNQLLAASLSLRESLFPPPFKNNQLSNPPIPLSLSFYHCIYALQLISSNIHNHFSASLSLSSFFSTF